MPIKAIFPTGLTEITVNGLHQWDYGRKLEIHSGDLPALVEVHFACEGMQEAEVRSGAAVNGVIEVTIPDKCLEQTSPVIAWVYRIDETQGTTIKTITMIITPRARPQKSEPVPAVISDKYTELIAAINEQVEALKVGDVTVTHAISADHATSADSATSAGHANSADSATSAGHATSADSAKTADSAIIADVARRSQAADYATGAGHAASADMAANANFAVDATTAAISSQAGVLSPSKLARKITSAGVYLVSWVDTSLAVPQAFSELLHIRDLSMFAYSNSGADNGAYYNSSTQQIEFSAMGYDTSTLVVLKIADYIEAAG